MIGYLALARNTFDINFANHKFSVGKSLLYKITKNTIGLDYLVTDNQTTNKALNFFKKNNCKKIVLIQATFTDAVFILKFTKIIKKPLCILSFSEPRTGGRLRLNSICGMNLALHALAKKNIFPQFIINNENLQKTKDSLSNFINKHNKFKQPKKWLKVNNLKKIRFDLNLDTKQNIGLIGTRPVLMNEFDL